MSFIGKLIHSPRGFTLISWGLTAVIVAALAALAIWKVSLPEGPSATIEPIPTQANSDPIDQPEYPDVASQGGIHRSASLQTNIPERPRYNIVEYTVSTGDSIFKIARDFDVEPETVLWANFDILNDSPDSIRIGQTLKIPPVDGVYYQWQEGDTLESIADEFEVTPDDILSWPGNNIDLTDPEIAQGTFIMVPGGEREFIQWIIPTIARGSSGTAGVGGSSCGGGLVGSGGFVWPAYNHYLTGNDYWSGHLAIDIAADTGATILAADTGVVTMAQGGWNYGYGNVIMIDHGNGYATLYAHLSQINVSVCQSVYQGQLIGLSGNTGNSFGSHLHFEVRRNGGHVNPWYVLPPP